MLWDFVQELKVNDSILNLDPIRNRLTDSNFLNPQHLATSGVDLRIVTVALETGNILLINQHGKVFEVNEHPWIELPSSRSDIGTTDVATAVLASASIPVMFPPQSVSGRTCVDAGVRELCPVRFAVEEGCHTVYAIHCGVDLGAEPARSRWTIPDIARRAVMDIVFDEISDNDLYPTGSYGPAVVRVIRPRVEVNDITTIDRGFIDINIDYGWMAASDTAAGLTFAQRRDAERSADLIVTRRLMARAAEVLYSIVKDQGLESIRQYALERVRQAKRAVRSAAEDRAKEFLLPPSPERWWQDWTPNFLGNLDGSPWTQDRAESPPDALPVP
jgi:predicted acylesterase/phospholipase RssA